MEPKALITITLEIGEWNAVIAALVEQPYRAVAPLVQKIGEQARGQTATASPKPNGETDYAPH